MLKNHSPSSHPKSYMVGPLSRNFTIMFLSHLKILATELHLVKPNGQF